MKHKEFIEDLEALSRQYWGKGFSIETVNLDGHNHFNRIVYLRIQDDTKPAVDMQDMAKQILGQK